MPRLAAPYVHEDRSGGVTIAVAMLLRTQRETLTERDVEQWVQKIDAAMAQVFGVDANTPVGITIRVAGKSGQRITEDLILGAAKDCATCVRRAREEEPTRTVDAHRTTRIWTAIILAWLPLLVKMSTRVLLSHRRAPAAASSEPRHARSTDRR
jgi:ATP-dependent Zn protease